MQQQQQQQQHEEQQQPQGAQQQQAEQLQPQQLLSLPLPLQQLQQGPAGVTYHDGQDMMSLHRLTNLEEFSLIRSMPLLQVHSLACVICAGLCVCVCAGVCACVCVCDLCVHVQGACVCVCLDVLGVTNLAVGKGEARHLPVLLF